MWMKEGEGGEQSKGNSKQDGEGGRRRGREASSGESDDELRWETSCAEALEDGSLQMG